jgi:hypothetical protein
MTIYLFKREGQKGPPIRVREDETKRLEIMNKARHWRCVGEETVPDPAPATTAVPSVPTGEGEAATPSVPQPQAPAEPPRIRTKREPKDPAPATTAVPSVPTGEGEAATPDGKGAAEPGGEVSKTGLQGNAPTGAGTPNNAPAEEFDVAGLPPRAREALEAAGLWSREAILASFGDNDGEALIAVDGVGPASLEILREQVR